MLLVGDALFLLAKFFFCSYLSLRSHIELCRLQTYARVQTYAQDFLENKISTTVKTFWFVFKRPARDACLCMGELLAPPAPPAPHFVFLITL